MSSCAKSFSYGRHRWQNRSQPPHRPPGYSPPRRTVGSGNAARPSRLPPQRLQPAPHADDDSQHVADLPDPVRPDRRPAARRREAPAVRREHGLPRHRIAEGRPAQRAGTGEPGYVGRSAPQTAAHDRHERPESRSHQRRVLPHQVTRDRSEHRGRPAPEAVALSRTAGTRADVAGRSREGSGRSRSRWWW